MKPKAILFDLDDTLFDSRYSIRQGLAAVQAMYECLQEQSLAMWEAQYFPLLDSFHHMVLEGKLTLEEARVERFRHLFAVHEGRLPADSAHQAAIVFREVYQTTRQTIPGAIPLLEYLRNHVRIGILTNNVGLEQRDKLTRCGLMPLIDGLVISEEVGVTKPDPAIFAISLREMNCEAQEAIMVGDSWSADVLGAQRAGIRPVWFNRFGETCPDSMVARVIESLEPPEIIGELLLFDG